MAIKRSSGQPGNTLGTADTGTTAGAATAAAGQRAQIPFTVASMMSSMTAATLAAPAGGAINNNPYGLPTRGFVRGMWLSVSVNVTGNAATVVAPTGAQNLPFSYISNISLTKPNGDILLPPNFNGTDLWLDNKYLARGFQPTDPKQSPVFVAPSTGAGSTAGTGKFILYIAFELDANDAFAAQPNADGAAQYQLNITTNTPAVAYGTANNTAAGVAPTASAVTLSFETMLDYWPVPAMQGAQTVPDSYGARQFLDLQTPPVTPSTSQVKLTAVGSGIRGMVFVLQNAAGARDDTDWPQLVRMELEGIGFFQRYQDIWKDEISRLCDYRFTQDTAGGIDSGVYVFNWPFSRQGFSSADSPRSQWLRTAPGSDLEFYPATFGAGATTLRVITNRVTLPSAQSAVGSGK
jgi:hypothetical protein